ncbi:MAG: NADH-quinone oxidoreductase subunit NuoE [Burkholderiaceae bacterium]
MSASLDKTVFSSELISAFDRETAKYPVEQRQSAVMACLTRVQQTFGYVSAQSESALADYLGMPAIAVHEVTTFYNMYNQTPVGRFKINVCTNLPCQLRGAQDALMHLCQTLSIEPGQTTKDGLITLQPAECMGACADAPVLLVNDVNMCSFMEHDKIDRLIEGLKQEAHS